MKINKFYAGIICGDDLLFSSRDVNGFYSYNLKDKSLGHIGMFENEVMSGKVLHKDCFLWDDNVVFIPQEAEKIHIYNYNSREKKHITIPKREMPPVAYIFDEEKEILWLIPSVFSDGFLKINICSNEVKMISVNPLEGENIDTPIFHRMAITSEQAIAPSINDGSLYFIYLDRENDKVEYVKKRIDKEIKGAFCGKDGVWLTSSNENIIYKYDCKLNKIVCEYNLYKEGSYNERNGLSNIIETENYIVTIPAWSDEIVVLDKCGKVVCRYVFSNYDYDKPLFIRSSIIDNNIYIAPANIDKMVVIHVECLSMELIDIPEIDMNEIEELKSILGNMQKEGELISLQEFLKYI